MALIMITTRQQDRLIPFRCRQDRQDTVFRSASFQFRYFPAWRWLRRRNDSVTNAHSCLNNDTAIQHDKLIWAISVKVKTSSKNGVTPPPSAVWWWIKKRWGHTTGHGSVLWVSFSALTLVRWQERHPAHKNLCQLFPKVLCWNKWKKATKDHLEQRWRRWQTYHGTTNQRNVLLKKAFQHRNIPLFVHPTSMDFPYM